MLTRLLQYIRMYREMHVDAAKSTTPCVYADQTVSVDSPYFWNEAFALQHSASGQLACPTFLQPLAQGILSTGKSLLLLRAHQDHHRRSACRTCLHCDLCLFNDNRQQQRNVKACHMDQLPAPGAETCTSSPLHRHMIQRDLPYNIRTCPACTWLIVSRKALVSWYGLYTSIGPHRHTPLQLCPEACWLQLCFRLFSCSRLLT